MSRYFQRNLSYFDVKDKYRNLVEAIRYRDLITVERVLECNPDLLDPYVELFLIQEGKSDLVEFIIYRRAKIFECKIGNILYEEDREEIILHFMKYKKIVSRNIEILLQKKLKKVNLKLLRHFKLNKKHFEMMDLKDPEIVAAGLANCKNDEDRDFWTQYSGNQEDDGYLILYFFSF